MSTMSSASNHINPLVSIIIVNWNGKKWLEKCLRSLNNQEYSNIEIVFVDNNSSDESIEYVSRNFPNVEIIQTGANLGFAGGNNIGYSKVHGKYVYLLNNDAYVETNTITLLVDFMEKNHKAGSVQSKITSSKDKNIIDVAGSFWSISGFLYHYGIVGKSSDVKYNQIRKFFSNKGASMLLRNEAIQKVGLFDDDFWCYYEETDLCNRLLLSGYEIWYNPTANIYHAGGGTSLEFDNSWIQFHNFKNKLLSFIKNYELKTLIVTLPIYLGLNLILSIVWLTKGKYKNSLSLLRAIIWNCKNIKSTISKRSIIQASRTVTDKGMLKGIWHEPPVKYYFALVTGNYSSYTDID